MVGIHWVIGTGNRFPYNLVYNNGDGTSDNEILIDDIGIIRPEIELSDPANDSEKVLICTKENDQIKNRWIRFKEGTVLIGQDAVIYKLDDTNTYKIPQADEYCTKCTVEEITDVEGHVGEPGCRLQVSSSCLNVDNTKCGIPDLYAVALVDSHSDTLGNYTTMLTANRFKLDGTVVALGTPEPIDIASGSPADGGGMESGGMQASGCGASIAPPGHQNTYGPGLVLWWLIFTAPAALILVRIKKR